MYQIEKIDGISLTDMYLSEILTENNLFHVLNAITRIQKTDIKEEQSINIYGNYVDKIKKRFSTYDYSKFKNSETTYNFLVEKLSKYITNDLGKKLLYTEILYSQI